MADVAAGGSSSWVRRAARALWAALVGFGTMLLRGEVLRAAEAAEVRRPAGGRPLLTRPPAGHPERLRPDVPFSPAELALLRDLMGR
ncbi:DUF6059 family protein [Streptomyces sp. NPDC012888]|uniref:DUF6059 family protein n=1 Tax=Streptomyces sp. NPDC012888 TaxID=3364855 RepID=UPI0036930117